MSTKLTSEQRKRAVSTVRDLMENAIGHGENFALIAVGNLEGVLDHCTALEEELKAASGLANVKNAMWEHAEEELDQIRGCDKCDLCEDHHD